LSLIEKKCIPTMRLDVIDQPQQIASQPGSIVEDSSFCKKAKKIASSAIYGWIWRSC